MAANQLRVHIIVDFGFTNQVNVITSKPARREAVALGRYTRCMNFGPRLVSAYVRIVDIMLTASSEWSLRTNAAMQ